ncbi:MAG: penicillin-binding transpeptidase domain-containing protein [Phycisphaerales bacterium]|nr:penicillin-binding transpeptidase domain-containing protein [Phycisphaerales bacterium]
MKSGFEPSEEPIEHAEDAAPDLKRGDRIARFILWSTAAVLAVGFGRTLQLQIAPDPTIAEIMGRRHSTVSEIKSRGSIVDAKGRLMAMSVIGYDLAVDVKIIMDRARDEGIDDPLTPLARLIGEHTGLESAVIEDRLFENLDARYVKIAEAEELLHVDRVMLRSVLPGGVVLSERTTRRTVDGIAGRAILGSVGDFGPAADWSANDALPISPDRANEQASRSKRRQRGSSGVEAARDRALEQTHGSMRFQKDVKNRPLFVREGDYEPGQDGGDIELTIDLLLQDYVEKRLARAVAEHHAVGGWIVVIDPVSGNVLAAHDLIDNEEGRRRGGWPESSLDPIRDELGRSFGRNRVWTDLVEPGSTMKPVFWSWAVSQGLADPAETIRDTKGRGTPGGGFGTSGRTFSYPGQRGTRRIKDAYGHSNVTWETALVKSLNTAMAMVALRMADRDRDLGHPVGTGMWEMFRAFGFLNENGINMPGEQTAMLTPLSAWTPLYSQLSVSFGQEIGVTPLQLARSYCPIARNDGRLPTMRIVRPASELPARIVPTAGVLAHADVMATRKALETVISPAGTGRHAVSEKGYRLWGKSGTPQMVRYEFVPSRPDADGRLGEGTWAGKGYWDERYNPNFVGAGPFHEPRLIVACGLNDPDKHSGANLDHNGHGYGGGYSAGRVVRDVLDHALEYLGVPPDEKTEVAAVLR